MKTLKVLLFDIDQNEIDESYITEVDRFNLAKYKVDKVRREKLLSTYVKNRYIGEYHIDEDGKPLSNNMYFNISHKGEYLVLVIDTLPVGIDIEDIRPVEDDLKNYISSEEEKEHIIDDASFYEIWTNKEAIVKANGKGIKQKVNTIPSLPIDGVKTFEGKQYRSRTVRYENYIITVCREDKEEFEIEIEKQF